MTEHKELHGAVTIVAGGTGGLGRPISDILRERGALVVTVSRTDANSENHILADLRSPDEAQRVVNEVIQRFGQLDIVVNAVGVVAFGEVATTTTDTVEELFLTNTFAHIFLCSSAVSKMAKGSVIVGISGVIAEQNLPGMAVYGSSKAALRSFNEAFAREARRVGVRVIDARPSHTETGLATRAIAGAAPRFPQGLSADDVATRIVNAIANGETDLPSTEFGK